MTGRRDKGRASDELTLAAVALRAEGKTTAEVGRLLGITSGNVVLRTNPVRDHDIAHPDPQAPRYKIAGAYW